MSWILNAILNSGSQELALIRQQAEALSRMASIAEAGLLPVLGTPGTKDVVSATNEFEDPQGIIGKTVGSYPWYGAPGLQPEEGTAPPGWTRCMVVTSPAPATPRSITAVGPAVAPSPSATVWVYALVESNQEFSVRLKGKTHGGYISQVVPAGGWRLVRMETAILPGDQLELLVEATLNAKESLRVTGVTICRDGDPGEPFSGDSPGNPEPELANHAYSWVGPRGNSASLQYGRQLDLLALFEAQTRLDVAPFGQSVVQRRAYLEARFQARHHPYGATFIELIVNLIRQDPNVSSSFGPANVRIMESYSNYSFYLEIDYSPTAIMAARVERLVHEIHPAHLAFEGPSGPIVWGTSILAPAAGAGTLDATQL